MHVITNEALLDMVSGGIAVADDDSGASASVGGDNLREERNGGGGSYIIDDGSRCLASTPATTSTASEVAGVIITGTALVLGDCIQGGKDSAGLAVISSAVSGLPIVGAAVLASGCLIESGYGIYTRIRK